MTTNVQNAAGTLMHYIASAHAAAGKPLSGDSLMELQIAVETLAEADQHARLVSAAGNSRPGERRKRSA